MKTEESRENPLNAQLALRPGEWLMLSDEEPVSDGSYTGSYAVMLLETPDLPGEAQEGVERLAIICGQKYATDQSEGVEAWGWVHLDFDTKEIIGGLLLDRQAVRGQWYYMVVSGGPGTRPLRWWEDR